MEMLETNTLCLDLARPHVHHVITICVCHNVCVDQKTTPATVLSFHLYTGPGDGTKVVRLTQQVLPLLNYLAGSGLD